MGGILNFARFLDGQPHYTKFRIFQNLVGKFGFQNRIKKVALLKDAH